ncbi:MAG: hypothetical protein MZW92_25365 [Comamonadaceae bacterium]|nr:hypothetical protein [Comamonadaceae bacterium]
MRARAPTATRAARRRLRRARLPVHEAELFLGNAGTAMRPLAAALLAATPGRPLRAVDGVPRMHERPIGDLVDALRALGCAHRLPRAAPASRRCASRPARRRAATRRADPRARRRLEPVPHRAAAGAAAGRRPQRRCVIEVDGELISQALRRRSR